MKKGIKKLISVVLAIAMIVGSLTYYPGDEVRADALPDFEQLNWTTVSGMYTDVAYSVVESSMTGYNHINMYGLNYMQVVGDGNSKLSEATFSAIDSNGDDITNSFTWKDTSVAVYGVMISELGTSDGYYLLTYDNSETGTVKVAIRIGNPGGESGGDDTPEGNIISGKTWQGWFEPEGWASYAIGESGKSEDGYTLTNKSIGANWYSIQTGVDGVSFSANKEYTCSFSFTTTVPKSLVIDNRSNDATIFVETSESANRGWINNGDGTYTYKYVGTYNSVDRNTLNVRVSLGYNANHSQNVIGDNDVNLGNFNPNDTITATLSNFVITPSDEYEEQTEAFTLDTPANLAFNSSTRVLTWDSVTDADSYNVYIKKPGSENYTSLATNVTGASYTVAASELTAYGTYNFVVEAYNTEHDTTSEKSSAATYTNEFSMEAPQNVTFTEATSTISWDSVTNADGYKVYIKAPGSNDYILLDGALTNNTYAVASTNLTAYGEYTFAVEAYNTANSYTTTKSTTTYTKVISSLDAPTNLSDDSDVSHLHKFSWSAVDGATGYKIYIDDATEAAATVTTTTAELDDSLFTFAEHTVYVSAYNETLESTKASVTHEPILTAPSGLSNNSTTELPHYFAWQYVKGATVYKIFVGNTEVGSTNGLACQIPDSYFPDSGEYTVSVQAINTDLDMESTKTSLTYEYTLPYIKLDVTASITSGQTNQINASWTNPAEVTADNYKGEEDENNTLHQYHFGYYVNRVDTNYQCKAANGWVWSTANPRELRTGLDTVSGTNGGNEVSAIDFKEGGDFAIIVVIYDSDNNIYAKGTSATIHLDEYVNTDLKFKLDRYENDYANTVVSWSLVGGAKQYKIINKDTGTQLAITGENNTWTQWNSPTSETQGATYTAKLIALDSDGNAIEGLSNDEVTLNYKYIGETTTAEPTTATPTTVPTDQDNDYSDATWIKLNEAYVNGTNNQVSYVDPGYNYYIDSVGDGVLDHGVWYQIYSPHNMAQYHNERTNCKINGAAFTFKRSNVKCIWVDNGYYGNPSTMFNNQGDCCEVALDDLSAGIHVISLLNNDNTVTTFALKKIAKQKIPNLNSVVHTYNLNETLKGDTYEFGDNYALDTLTFTFTNTYPEGEATYKVYADWQPNDGVDYVEIGTLSGSGESIIGIPEYAGVNSKYKITSIVNGVESAYSNEVTLNYSQELMYSSATSEYTNSFNTTGTVFASQKGDNYDYTDYDLVNATSSSGTAKNVINNNLDSLGSSATDPQWVEIDLKNEYIINEFDLSWDVAKSKSYFIEVSDDGENYTTVFNLRNAGHTDSTDATLNHRDDVITLDAPVTARFVRVFSTARTTAYEHNLQEIAIYGPEEDKTLPDSTDDVEQELIDPTKIKDEDWVRLNTTLSESGATAWVTTDVAPNLLGISSTGAGYTSQSDIHDWNNIKQAAIYNEPIFGFYPNTAAGATTGQVTGLIINGIEYTNPAEMKNRKVLITNNQCVYINQELIDAEPGETKYYTITVLGNTLDTFIVKVVGADKFTYTVGGDGVDSATYEDAPDANTTSYTGAGGYGFSFAQNQTGFAKTKSIDNVTNTNYLRYPNITATGTSERQAANLAIDSADGINGNAGSRWESIWDSPYSTGEGITIDMGAVYDINEVDILWERANAKNFNIQVSTDGDTWKEVFAVTKTNAYYDTGVDNVHYSDRVDTMKLAATTEARYVKITGTVKSLTDIGEYGYSIWDVAIYGPEPSKFIPNIYATYARDEAVYTRWDAVEGATTYTTKLLDSEGNEVDVPVTGTANRAAVLDVSSLANETDAGTYTVFVEGYDANGTKITEGTKDVVITATQDKTDIHENAGSAPGGKDRYDATLTYEATIKNVHGHSPAVDLGLNLTYIKDSSNDVINVAYNADLNDVEQAIVFVNGRPMTAEDGVLNWDNQILKLNETKIPENSITTYDIYLTIAHVRLVVNKGETAKSQIAEIFESPNDLTVETGSDYLFKGSAGGSNVTYQWQYQDGEGAWTDIEGATEKSVSGIAKMALNGRKFRFIAQAHDNTGANYGQSVTSEAATLTVIPKKVEGLELNNDDGQVYAQWQAKEGATKYDLIYTYNEVEQTISDIPADQLIYDFTDAYGKTPSLGYPDNGTDVTIKYYFDGQDPQTSSDTAFADLYIDSVSMNNGDNVLKGKSYDSVLVIKNRGTAWVDISTTDSKTDFEATASANGWNPTIVGANDSELLPDMLDSDSITYTGFVQATAGTYTVNYNINTKMQTLEEQPVHVIVEGTNRVDDKGQAINAYANNSMSLTVDVLEGEPVIKVDSSKAAVQGFQIRTNQGEDFNGDFNGSVAFRTVCKAPSIGSTFTARNGKNYTVKNVGVIYLLDPNNTSGDNSKTTYTADDTLLDVESLSNNDNGTATYVGSNQKTYAKGFVCTDNAILENKDGVTTYAITMQGMDENMANTMLVRSFIVTDNDEIIYSTKIAKVSVAEIAEYMYYNSLCNNDNGHDYLYNAILHNSILQNAESKYYRTETVEYGWNSTLYDKLPN